MHRFEQHVSPARIKATTLGASRYMRRISSLLILLLVIAVPTSGQARFQPPPDHWMTIDSLSQALDLSAGERTKVAAPYDSLNAVMSRAAVRRQALRQQMQSAFQAGEPSPDVRARMDSARAQMQEFQTEADKWVASIRANLTAGQQAKFDSLPKPQLVRPRSMGGVPTRP